MHCTTNTQPGIRTYNQPYFHVFLHCAKLFFTIQYTMYREKQFGSVLNYLQVQYNLNPLWILNILRVRPTRLYQLQVAMEVIQMARMV